MANAQVGVSIVLTGDDLAKLVKKVSDADQGVKKATASAKEATSGFSSFARQVIFVNQAIELAQRVFGALENVIVGAVRRNLEFRSTVDPIAVSMRHFGEEIEKTESKVGSLFLPALLGIAQAFTPVLKALQNFLDLNHSSIEGGIIEVMVKAGSVLASVFATVAKVIAVVTLGISTGFNAAILVMDTAIGKLAGGISSLLQKLSDLVKSSPLAKLMKKEDLALLDMAVKGADEMAEHFKRSGAETKLKMIENAEATSKFVKEMDVLKKDAQAAFDEAGKAAQKFKDKIKGGDDPFAKLRQQIQDALKVATTKTDQVAFITPESAQAQMQMIHSISQEFIKTGNVDFKSIRDRLLKESGADVGPVNNEMVEQQLNALQRISEGANHVANERLEFFRAELTKEEKLSLANVQKMDQIQVEHLQKQNETANKFRTQQADIAAKHAEEDAKGQAAIQDEIIHRASQGPIQLFQAWDTFLKMRASATKDANGNLIGDAKRVEDEIIASTQSMTMALVDFIKSTIQSLVQELAKVGQIQTESTERLAVETQKVVTKQVLDATTGVVKNVKSTEFVVDHFIDSANQAQIDAAEKAGQKITTVATETKIHTVTTSEAIQKVMTDALVHIGEVALDTSIQFVARKLIEIAISKTAATQQAADAGTVAAANAAGAATSAAAKASEATANVTATAAEAGAGAAASQAGIPIVGPVLALAAMAAMVVAVLGLTKMIKFASGGPVMGGTPGSDSVPALLTPDEYVLPVNVVRAIRASGSVPDSVIAAIVGGRPPPSMLARGGFPRHYSSGGSVGSIAYPMTSGDSTVFSRIESRLSALENNPQRSINVLGFPNRAAIRRFMRDTVIPEQDIISGLTPRSLR